MSRSVDPGHFFQSSYASSSLPFRPKLIKQSRSAIEEQERKSAKREHANKAGDPIQLPSKLLAVLASPSSKSEVYVSESAGSIRRVILGPLEPSKEHTRYATTYRGPDAPLTSLAISPSRKHVFAGCWDKAVWSWVVDTRHPYKKYTGHTDFVKCVAVAPLKLSGMGGTEIVIAGGADGAVLVWSVLSGARLHLLKGESGRGILALSLDPWMFLSDAHQGQTPKENAAGQAGEPHGQEQAIGLWTASSTGELRRYRISATSADPYTKPGAPVGDEQKVHTNLAAAHETSINAVFITQETVTSAEFVEAGTSSIDDAPDMWTASSDKTAKQLSRTQGYAADTTLEHPDFVRAVVVSEELGLVVTACRDEDVRVWDAASGDLICTYAGHWEEVTGLCLRSINGKRVVVSVGIDGTIRTWSLEQNDLRDTAAAAASVAAASTEKDHADQNKAAASSETSKQDAPKHKIELTEDEERELAELMEDDSD